MTTNHGIVLVGGPDSGKTNFLARLWEALRARQGALIAPDAPGEIKYVEDALAHLLQGRFAPRSDKNTTPAGQSFTVPVVLAENPQAEPVQVVVPDVSGELWKAAVETCELPPEWMSTLRTASGALIFVRIGSDLNIAPLDWVTASELLSMPAMLDDADEEGSNVPTQVALCELLRFLEHSMGADNHGVRPRVAVLVTAWDRLDPQSSTASPMAYLFNEFPLFAGRFRDITSLDVRTFGVSVVGGDFIDDTFTQRFFEEDLSSAGYVVEETDGHVVSTPDLTRPVAWVVEGISRA